MLTRIITREGFFFQRGTRTDKAAAAEGRITNAASFTVSAADWYEVELGAPMLRVDPAAAANLTLPMVADQDGTLDTLGCMEALLAPRILLSHRQANGTWAMVHAITAQYTFPGMPTAVVALHDAETTARELMRVLRRGFPDPLLAAFSTGGDAVAAFAKLLLATMDPKAEGTHVLTPEESAIALPHFRSLAAALPPALQPAEVLRAMQQIDRLLEGSGGKLELARLAILDDRLTALRDRMGLDDVPVALADRLVFLGGGVGSAGARPVCGDANGAGRRTARAPLASAHARPCTRGTGATEGAEGAALLGFDTAANR